ncbi:MAG: hypothetical protein ACK4Z6_04505 [Candidatus Methylomirabilales bacterium]
MILQLNFLPIEEREAIYPRLIPEELFETFGIDRRTLTDRSGRRLVTFLCPPGQDLVRIEVWLHPLPPAWDGADGEGPELGHPRWDPWGALEGPTDIQAGREGPSDLDLP